MMDIKEVIQDFQKLNKTENCIVIHLKNDQKVAITSPVSHNSLYRTTTGSCWWAVFKIYLVDTVIPACKIWPIIKNFWSPFLPHIGKAKIVLKKPTEYV